MNIIELIESCYGPDIRIDNESLFLHEYDERSEEYIIQLKLRLLTELIKNVKNLSIHDCISIGEIIVSNDDWENIDDESYQSTCDQCGNYNYKNKYKRFKNE